MKYFFLALLLISAGARAQSNNNTMNNPLALSPGSKVTIRYIVQDVDAAVKFYTELLGFVLDMRPAPGFAALSRGNLRLLMNRPGSGGTGQSMPDGTVPQPGGWNRFQIEVEDLKATISSLKAKGAQFRNELVKGYGGDQILLLDPSGNVIELFQPPHTPKDAASAN